MKTKHTEGNWNMMVGGFSKKGNVPNMIQIYSTNDDLEMICKVHKDGLLHAREQDFEANAKLIASAPELLKALQDLVDLKDRKDHIGKDEFYIEKQKEAWGNAKKALMKALT